MMSLVERAVDRAWFLLVQAIALCGPWLYRALTLWPRSLGEAWLPVTSWPGLVVGVGIVALLVAARHRARREAHLWRLEDGALRLRVWRS
jgi:hypothetical protein